MPNTRALQQVREQRGLGIAEVAEFATISPNSLLKIEQGDREPSRQQMERLAQTYGVPLYTLFGSAIPNIAPLPQDFRKSDPTPATLSPRGLKTLFAVEKAAEFGQQLALELDYQAVDWLSEVRSIDSAIQSARSLRAIFDRWYLPRQARLNFSGRAEDRFMGAFRLFLEVQGIVVQVNDAPPDDYFGFFLNNEVALPAVFVNRSILSRKAQLFTLVHECGHVLLGKAGISNPFVARNATERFCNMFAAEFLAPMRQFTSLVEGLPTELRSDTDALIRAVSLRSLLSKHASAIRLIEGGYIERNQYRLWLETQDASPQAEKKAEKEDPEAGGGPVPHAKRVGEVGHLPVMLAFNAVRAGFIDNLDVANGLGVSLALQDRAYGLVAKRFEAALT